MIPTQWGSARVPGSNQHLKSLIRYHSFSHVYDHFMLFPNFFFSRGQTLWETAQGDWKLITSLLVSLIRTVSEAVAHRLNGSSQWGNDDSAGAFGWEDKVFI